MCPSQKQSFPRRRPTFSLYLGTFLTLEEKQMKQRGTKAKKNAQKKFIIFPLALRLSIWTPQLVLLVSTETEKKRKKPLPLREKKKLVANPRTQTERTENSLFREEKLRKSSTILTAIKLKI